MRRFIQIVEAITDIDGLPPHVDVKDPALLGIINNPRHRVSAHETPRGDYDLVVHPANTAGMASTERPSGYGPSRHVYYDPTKATLRPYDDDPEIARGRMTPELDPGFTQEIAPLDGAVMYRGISAEEMAHIHETGLVKSDGSYNMEGQDELTYWSTEIASAVSYANSFAPSHRKAAPGFPAYVIAAPLATNVRHIPGVGAHEVGVVDAVPLHSLLAIWEGKVWSFTTGSDEVRQGWNGWERGSSSAASASLEWKRVK